MAVASAGGDGGATVVASSAGGEENSTIDGSAMVLFKSIDVKILNRLKNGGFNDARDTRTERCILTKINKVPLYYLICHNQYDRPCTSWKIRDSLIWWTHVHEHKERKSPGCKKPSSLCEY